MKRRLGEDLTGASEERVWEAKKDMRIERPKASGISEGELKRRYWVRKVARESGDLNRIRWSFGAPSLGRNSRRALGWGVH
jgi:hypothetical protein